LLPLLKVSSIGRSDNTLIVNSSYVAALACDPASLPVTGMGVVSQPGVATTQPHTLGLFTPVKQAEV